MTPLIEAKDLSVRYGNHWALKNLQFKISSGEKVALVGPNGSGKTTLMRVMCGLLSPDRGCLVLAHRHPQSQWAKKQVAYLPENNPLPNNFRVQEYLWDRACFYRQPRTRLSGVLEKFDLTRERRQIIGRLSQGTRRRVGLAAAFITGAPILVLDEPTSGLDPQQIRELRTYLRNLKKHTLIMATHIIPDAEAICERALILNAGVLTKDTSVENVDLHFRKSVL